MPDFPVSASSSCLCHEKFVIQALLYSFLFRCLIAGGCDSFLSCFCGIFIWSGQWYRWFGQCWTRKGKHDCMLCCAILMQLDVEWKQSRENHSVQMLYSNRNGMVRYLAVSTHTLGPVDSRRGEGELLLACDAYGIWCDWVFIVLLADWHWMQSCLAGTSTCFWTQGIEPANHTKRSVSASTWYQWRYFLLVLGKHLLVKTSICQSSRGCDDRLCLLCLSVFSKVCLIVGMALSWRLYRIHPVEQGNKLCTRQFLPLDAKIKICWSWEASCLSTMAQRQLMMVRVWLHVKMVPFMVFKYNGLFSVTPKIHIKRPWSVSVIQKLFFIIIFLTAYNNLKNTYLIQQIQQKSMQNWKLDTSTRAWKHTHTRMHAHARTSVGLCKCQWLLTKMGQHK